VCKKKNECVKERENGREKETERERDRERERGRGRGWGRGAVGWGRRGETRSIGIHLGYASVFMREYKSTSQSSLSS